MELESDGDLDLVISTDSGLRILQNNGNRTFEDVTAFSSLPPAGWLPTSLVVCDYDRDLDMDLVCSSATVPYLAVLENILHSQLRYREFDQGEGNLSMRPPLIWLWRNWMAMHRGIGAR